jgi:pSer/pThr/pTyr-binding forkhead associated (FHA) protein
MKAWTIGRSRTADIIIGPDQGSVSRAHAELVETDDGRYYLTDCDSRFGTYIKEKGGNWKRFRQTYVQKRDHIRLGEHEITVAELLTLVPDDSEPRPVPQYVFVTDRDTARESDSSDISELPHGPVERDPATGKIIRRS